MKYIEIDYLDSILMNALEELINRFTCNVWLCWTAYQ